MCVTIILEEEQEPTRKSIDKVHQLSSVKKLLIISITPDVPESYENMKTTEHAWDTPLRFKIHICC